MDQNTLLKKNPLCNYTPTHVSEFNNCIAGALPIHGAKCVVKSAYKLKTKHKYNRGFDSRRAK